MTVCGACARAVALRRSIAITTAASLAFGCASTGSPSDLSGAQAGREDHHASPIAVYDPFEGLNRELYKFNAQADRYVLLPVVDAYKFVIPIVFRDRISDFFANLATPITFANQLLQLKFEDASKTALRFAANTMLGMAGFVDIATPMGMPKYAEDFGQTLGYWGVADGAYIVLPILGPSNVRDAIGTGIDLAASSTLDPLGTFSLGYARPGVLAVNVINARYTQPFRYYETGSPFEYDLVRFLYTKKREVEIGRALPPRAPVVGGVSEQPEPQVDELAGARDAP